MYVQSSEYKKPSYSICLLHIHAFTLPLMFSTIDILTFPVVLWAGAEQSTLYASDGPGKLKRRLKLKINPDIAFKAKEKPLYEIMTYKKLSCFFEIQN